MTQAVVLEHAGISTTTVVVVTIPDPTTALAVIELIRSMNSRVHIIARSRYHQHHEKLYAAGADDVIDEEQQVGTRLAARLRRHLRAIGRSSIPH